MPEFPERDPRTIKSEFDVWLRHSMIYNNPPPEGKSGQNLKTYPALTKAKKVKYKKTILHYLDEMESKDDVLSIRKHEGRAVAVELDGIVRYMWRDDIYTKRELDESQASKRAGLRALRGKPQRNVGKDPTG